VYVSKMDDVLLCSDKEQPFLLRDGLGKKGGATRQSWAEQVSDCLFLGVDLLCAFLSCFGKAIYLSIVLVFASKVQW
jgi:hypothetical protein